MRELTDHKVNPANDRLTILAEDGPSSGGASHRYSISGYDAKTNKAEVDYDRSEVSGVVLLFQNGPIAEVGVNGITHEALLAVLCDRMRGFQAGPYANVDNAAALKHLEAAQASLLARTRARMGRGVEGTHAV